MNTLLKILSVLLIIILTLSCEKETLYNERQLVINDFFTANEPFTVEITESSSSFDTNKFVLPNDLEVLLYEGDEPLGNLNYAVLPPVMQYQATNVFPIDKRIFYTNPLLIPENGKEYTIKVFKSDKLLATAKNTVPQPAIITKVDTFQTFSILYGLKLPMLTFNVQFQEIENTTNFYALSYKIIENYSDTLIIHHQAAEIWSKEAISQYSYEYRNDSGFTGKYLVFTDELIKGNAVNFTFEITKVGIGGRTQDCKNTIVVYLYTISKEYYQYVKSYNMQQKVNEDLYSEPIQMFSNIDDGQGIFAGSSYDTYIINIPDSYNGYYSE